jgi:hypothetical protein
MPIPSRIWGSALALLCFLPTPARAQEAVVPVDDSVITLDQMAEWLASGKAVGNPSDPKPDDPDKGFDMKGGGIVQFPPGPWEFQGAWGDWIPQDYELETARIDGGNFSNGVITRHLEVSFTSATKIAGEVSPVEWVKLSGSVEQTLTWKDGYDFLWPANCGRIVIVFLTKQRGRSLMWTRTNYEPKSGDAVREYAWGWAVQANPSFSSTRWIANNV